MAMNVRAKLLTLATIPWVMVLGACEPKRIETVRPPAALTECAVEPVAPDLPRVDWSSVETARPTQQQRDLATFGYILALRTAYGDCAADVAGLKAWSDGL